MRSVALLLFVLGDFCALAQNLVPNPGFEDFTVCPGSYSRRKEEFRLPHWYSPNLGTPDAYNACGSGEADVPYNWAGISEAYEGNGYAGIYLWFNGKNFREYLQCKLIQPLLKDTTYVVSFRYRLSSYSKFCIDRIGLHFSDSSFFVNHDRPIRLTPALHVITDSALTPSTGLWELAEMEYRARGNEQVITIGNFHNDQETEHYEITHRPVQEEMLKEAAYYYIDNVVIRMKFDPTELLPVLASFSRQDVKLNERYVLDNILFEFNSFKLLRRSFEQLDEVVAVLKSNTDYRLRISGHTDDVGSEQYNLRLSRMRAKTVEQYLIQSGIPAERIQSEGFGKSMPLIEGETEAIRRINRRVELTFFR
jgi:Outer membrane protein and related peptidoglycan-associated (lipo)proteins